MYCTVPLMPLGAAALGNRVAVSGRSIVAVSEASIAGIRTDVRAATPKSSSLTSGELDGRLRRTSITLPGFRSRWTMPARCARSSASAI